MLDAYGWELYNAHRFREAVEAGRAAVALYERLDDPVAVGECLVRVSRHLFMAGDTDAAEVNAAARRDDPRADRPRGRARPRLAVRGSDPGHDRGRSRHGRPTILASARDLAMRVARPDLAALALNYLGLARVAAGDAEGIELLRESIVAAERARQYEYAARGYTNLAELLFRAGRLDELERLPGGGPARSSASAASGRTPTASRSIAARRCCGAAAGSRRSRACARSSTTSTTPACSYAYSVPLARVACWRGAATRRPPPCSRPRGGGRAGNGC